MMILESRRFRATCAGTVTKSIPGNLETLLKHNEKKSFARCVLLSCITTPSLNPNTLELLRASLRWKLTIFTNVPRPPYLSASGH
jgi:hypothetical protein